MVSTIHARCLTVHGCELWVLYKYSQLSSNVLAGPHRLTLFRHLDPGINDFNTFARLGDHD